MFVESVAGSPRESRARGSVQTASFKSAPNDHSTIETFNSGLWQLREGWLQESDPWAFCAHSSGDIKEAAGV